LFTVQAEAQSMCFGIPMQVLAIDGLMARCAAKGVERHASLLMMQHEQIAVGDHVVVHLGHVIDTVSADQAAAAWSIYDALLEADAHR
jgi:hydrogenase expression/formation protein HypC